MIPGEAGWGRDLKLGGVDRETVEGGGVVKSWESLGGVRDITRL